MRRKLARIVSRPIRLAGSQNQGLDRTLSGLLFLRMLMLACCLPESDWPSSSSSLAWVVSCLTMPWVE